MLNRLLANSLSSENDRAVFRQLSDGLIRLINDGVLRPGNRLTGTRTLAQYLQLNRKTIITAYEDAADQGYLVSRPGSGYYVSQELPFRPRWNAPEVQNNQTAAFSFGLKTPAPSVPDHWLRFTEGAPDSRLAELDKIYGGARQLLQRKTGKSLSRYGDGQGDVVLRNILSDHLSRSRGIPASAEKLLITRGSQHGFQLASRLLFREGGLLAIATLSYDPIIQVAQDYGAEIIRIPLDEEGMVVTALEQHPRLEEIKAVYVTPHHQYPTTVTLSANRRLRLLDLASEKGFAILEDDYDYDFHYGQGPLLPLAALDKKGTVIYLGSFTKVISPGLRIGYLIGPADFIQSALYHRLLTDRQGDLLLERSLARYIEAGDLDRHLRKVRPIYQKRRDYLSLLLRHTFGNDFIFSTPAGGMAIWFQFPEDTNLKSVIAKTAEQQMSISPSAAWWQSSRGMRLGFASLDEEEQEWAVGALARSI